MFIISYSRVASGGLLGGGWSSWESQSTLCCLLLWDCWLWLCLRYLNWKKSLRLFINKAPHLKTPHGGHVFLTLGICQLCSVSLLERGSVFQTNLFLLFVLDFWFFVMLSIWLSYLHLHKRTDYIPPDLLSPLFRLYFSLLSVILK